MMLINRENDVDLIEIMKDLVYYDKQGGKSEWIYARISSQFALLIFRMNGL